MIAYDPLKVVESSDGQGARADHVRLRTGDPQRSINSDPASVPSRPANSRPTSRASSQE